MKLPKDYFRPLFRKHPWLIPPAGIAMLLGWPILLPLSLWRHLSDEVIEVVSAYFIEAWEAARFTGFSDHG
jgi:hypothetical protein